MSYRRLSSAKSARRGQVVSWEFLLACTIFFFTLATAVTHWKSTTDKISESERFNVFDDTAVNVAEKLVRTRGVPENWPGQTVYVVGLADEPRMLNRSKVSAFLVLMNDSSNDSCGDISNYKCNKNLLGVGKFDFYFNMTDINGTTIIINNMTCTAGQFPPPDVDQITIPRTGILDGGIVRIKLTLWSNYTVVNT
jgi:hypothetical protein